MNYDRAGLAGASLALAVLAYMATCAAHAAEQQARVRNPDPTQTVAAVRLCDASGCQPEVAVTIAPGATAAVRFPTAPAGRAVHVQARTADSGWSSPSNTMDAAACLLDDACRFDIDRDGGITPTDFSAFLAVLGTSR